MTHSKEENNFDLRAVAEVDNFINTYLLEQHNLFQGNNDAERKIRHTESCCKIFDMLYPKCEEAYCKLLRVSVKAHDIGRFKQLAMIGSYDDKIIHHNDLGEDIINTAILEKSIANTPEARLVRTVIKYHGTVEFLDQSTAASLPQEALAWAKIVTIIDDIENACITAPTRLENEIMRDTKHLVKAGLDQTRITGSNLDNYLNKQKIDRKLCATYADYILFNLSIIRKFLYTKEYSTITKSLITNEVCLRYVDIIDRFICVQQASDVKEIFLQDLGFTKLPIHP